MRDCQIEDVTDDHVIEWITLFKKMGYQTATLIKKEEALIQFYKFWERRISLSLDPLNIPLTDKEYTKPRVCTDDKYQQLLSVLPLGTDSFKVRNRAILTLLWNTGMRIGELASLNISDIKLEEKLVIIKTEKSKGVRPFRTIPYDVFDDEAVEALPVWIERRKHLLENLELEEPDALFFGVKTTNARGRRLALQALGEIFAKTSKRAGLTKDEYVNPHAVRHHFGHGLAKRSLNNSVISESMGHAQISSSYRYTQLEAGDLAEMLRART